MIWDEAGVTRRPQDAVRRLQPEPEGVLRGEPGLQLLAFSAAPGSPSDDGLRLLTTWAATAQVESVGNTISS